LRSAAFKNKLYNTSYLYEEVNCTELSSSVSVPLYGHQH
jgi:hypothetical protein